MKQMLPFVVLVTLVTGVVQPAYAEDSSAYYLGIDAFLWTYDENGFDEAEGTGIRGRFGDNFSENFAIELHLATGGDDTVSGINLDLDWLFSILFRGNLPLGKANLYGLLGITNAEFTASVPSVSISGNESSFSYGVGADFKITDRTYLNADYIVYLDESNYDFSALSIGIRYNL